MTVPAVCAVTVPAVAAAVAVGGAVSAAGRQQDDSGDGEERRPPALTAPARLTDAWAEPAAEDKFLKVPPRCRAAGSAAAACVVWRLLCFGFACVCLHHIIHHCSLFQHLCGFRPVRVHLYSGLVVLALHDASSFPHDVRVTF